MNKKALLTGASLGLLTVAVGAFGAHGLKPLLQANGRLAVFETAVQYQSMHAIALLIVGIMAINIKSVWLSRSVSLFAGGVLIFSGSLYVLSITNISWWGAVAPFGGLLLILGWLAVILAIIKDEA